MNISRKWLSDYIELNCSDEELCARLTAAGIEVEAVESGSPVPAGVVVARIESREPHPGSDHLSVCKVFDGKETLQIVCGAPNCDAGKIVPLATIGTVFHTPEGEFKIKKSKLRGVESCGMMCSAKEIGVGDDDSGLLILDPALKPGTPLCDLYRSDTKIEVEVTPNRADWLSMFGIARDVACLLRTPARLPVIAVPPCTVPAPGLVTVEAPDLCTRYIGRTLKNVKVGPSPAWMVERLEAVGLRSINNVVDITNFVLMELGQPLHAFDLNKLSGRRVVARRAKTGEKIVTLDGSELELSEANLVIADAERPMALAGIMGGEFSGVSDDTTEVLIESACFNSANIRNTSRKLGIASDSSYRFERGVDYDMTAVASDRAVQLLIELAGAELSSETVDVTTGRPEEKKILCRFERIRKLIGCDVANERMVEIFRDLRLEVSDITPEKCTVTAPLFRPDLEREADLAEEVARVNGLDAVPIIPVRAVRCIPESENDYDWQRELRELAVGLGFYECMHYSIVSVNSALSDRRFKESDLIRLKNPLNQEQPCMRCALLGEMLGTVARNFSRGNRDLFLFELDKAFCANASLFPEERWEMLFVMTGRRHPELYSDAGRACVDFFDLKGVFESLFEALKIRNYRFAECKEATFRAGHALEVILEGKSAGAFGEIAPDLCSGFRATAPVFAGRIDPVALRTAASRIKIQYKELCAFPAIERDVACVAPASASNAEVLEFIRRLRLPNFDQVKLFDIFVDDKLRAEGKKSVAYTLTFRNSERTLTDNEVNAAMEKLRARLAADLKFELR